jgi:uncharacterized membrane protein
MFVVFPIALWIFSFVSDLIYFLGWGGPVWQDVAFRSMAGGVVGALLAAIPGFIDFLSLSGRSRKIATIHMSLNLLLVLLYAVNLWIRAGAAELGRGPVVLSGIALVILFISGWLGGSLVYVHATAVECENQGVGNY